MSRTDAHRPPRVHLAETQAATEFHDHSTGPCDLPDLADVISGRVDQGWRAGRRCGWWLTVAYQHDHSPYSAYPQFFTRKDPKHARRSKKADIRKRLDDYTDLDSDND